MGWSDGKYFGPTVSFSLKSKFSNPAFVLVYLGQGERSLGNLLKNLGREIYIPNLLKLLFGGF